MTNQEMINYFNGLELMRERETNALNLNPEHERMNIVIAYKIFANKKILSDKLKPYYESLKELMSRFNVQFVKSENGEIATNVTELSKDKQGEYTKELNKLLNIDVDVDIQKVSLEQFKDYRISQEDLAALIFMITE